MVNIKKELAIHIDEFKYLIENIVNDGYDVTIQQRRPSENKATYFTFNMPVKSCYSVVPNELQFRIGNGYINLVFEENYDKETFEEQPLNLSLEFDSDKDSYGYWFYLDSINIRLKIEPEKFEAILKGIPNKLAEVQKKKELYYEALEESNKNMPEGFWNSVDNMLEK